MINVGRITEIVFIIFLWFISSTLICAQSKGYSILAPNPYLNLVRLIGRQEYDEAIAQGFKLIESNTSSQRACERVVEAARVSSQLHLAQDRFESLLQLSPPNLFGYYGLGLVHEENKNPQAAITSYQSFLKAKPLSPAAIQKVIRLICASGNYAEAETYARSFFDLSGNPALAQFALGSYFSAVGKTEEAIIEFDKAATSELLRADACYNKADALSEAERYDGSLETVKKCLPAIESLLDYDQLFSFRRMLASHLLSAGNFGEARKIIEQIQQTNRLVGDSQAEEASHGYLGILNHRQSKYSIALSFYLQSVEVARKHGRLANGRTLGNIASAYFTLGDITNAINYYAQALPVSLNAKDERNYAALLLRLGGLYESQNDIPKALKYYQQLMDLQQNRQNRPALRLATEAAAILHLRTGDYAKAKELILQGLTAATEDKVLPNELSLLTRLGELHLRTQEFNEAISVYQGMLRLGEDNDYSHYDWAAYAGIALAYENQRQFSQARENYLEAIKKLENVRSELKVENFKIGYFESKTEVYRRLVRLLMKLHVREPGKGYNAEAFHFSERSRARALLDTLKETDRSTISPELKKQQQTLQNQLSKLETELAEANAEKPPDREKIKSLQARVLMAISELTAWKGSAPRGSDLLSPEPLTVEQVQQMLRGN